MIGKSNKEPIDKVGEQPTHPTFVASGRRWEAKGKVVGDGFVVFAGSTCKAVSPSFHKNAYFATRQELEATGVIVDLTLTKDFTFRSAGQAGCVIGVTGAGSVVWETDDNYRRPFKDVYPKIRGEKARYSEPTRAKTKDEKLKEGFSRMEDGTPRFVEIRNGMVYEYRGKEAEDKARNATAA